MKVLYSQVLQKKAWLFFLCFLNKCIFFLLTLLLILLTAFPGFYNSIKNKINFRKYRKRVSF
jgi:hypothetical protein